MPWIYASCFLKTYQGQLKELMNIMAMVAEMEVVYEINNMDTTLPNQNWPLLMLAASFANKRDTC